MDTFSTVGRHYYRPKQPNTTQQKDTQLLNEGYTDIHKKRNEVHRKSAGVNKIQQFNEFTAIDHKLDHFTPLPSVNWLKHLSITINKMKISLFEQKNQ